MEYSFNNQSFDIEIEIRNDKNSVKLTQNGFSELSFEEDLFNWEVTGYLILSNRYEMFRKNPDATENENPNSFYKYMGNGQDIISVKIHPKLYSSSENQSGNEPKLPELPFKQWGIQFEASICDVEDMGGDGENKTLKLIFVEHAMIQMMNKNIEFSTTEMATEGMSDEEIINLDNYDRSLKIGDAVYSLLHKAKFDQYLKNYMTPKWNVGDDKNKIFHTSPSNQSVEKDLAYLLGLHTSDVAHKYEPCFFMFDRNETPDTPKQFSLVPVSEFYKKAGVHVPLEYTIEDFTLVNNIQHEQKNVLSIQKTPSVLQPTTTVGIRAIEYSDVKTYDFQENQALRNIKTFNNKLPVSFNPIDGQYNFEKFENTSEEVRRYLEENYVSLMRTQDKKSRVSLNKEIKDGSNSEILSTTLQTREARYAIARNKLLLTMMFNSMGISFSARGMTIRQPGRFIGISKRGELNMKDFDHRIEGQYILTNVRHCFTTEDAQYVTDMHAAKFQVYAEKFKPDEDANNSKFK